MTSPTHDVSWLPAIGLILLLAITAAVFWPALGGPFLFDDLIHLPELGRDGGIDSLGDLLRFAFSSDSGPLRRPLAMLSFALNDQAWPADPWSFKYTNLMLHLLNGVLVFALVRQLGRLTDLARRADWLALAVTALWLLHPIQLSTMMQVVQRMTELMALFTLLGLIAYLHGRRRVVTRPWRGYAWMTLGIGMLGPLAVLCKENGILICLYALVIEATLIRRSGLDRPRGWLLWSGLFLILPLLALAGYLLRPVGMRLLDGSLNLNYAGRDFSLLERLLTESRILLDYLGQILLPRLTGSSLFHDDYPVSRGLLDPPVTTACVVLILGALAFALLGRRRYPVAAFAILWFLGGQVLESTVVGLELYFEHRNYLPMLGPVFAIVYGLFRLSPRPARIALLGAPVYLGLVIFISYQNSTIWGNGFLLAQTWAQENPESFRAQGLAARYWLSVDKIDQALEHARLAVRHNPEETAAHADVFIFRCLQGKATAADAEHLARIFRTGRFSHMVLQQFEGMRTRLLGRCPGLNSTTLQRLLAALDANPAFGRSRQRIAYEQGRLGLMMNDPVYAMHGFDRAFAVEPNVDIALTQALVLASEGRYDRALDHIAAARKTAGDTWTGWFVDRRPDIKQVEQQIRNARLGHSSLRLEFH